MKLRYRPGAFAPRTPCGGPVIAFKWPGRPPPRKNPGDASEYKYISTEMFCGRLLHSLFFLTISRLFLLFSFTLVLLIFGRRNFVYLYPSYLHFFLFTRFPNFLTGSGDVLLPLNPSVIWHVSEC